MKGMGRHFEVGPREDQNGSKLVRHNIKNTSFSLLAWTMTSRLWWLGGSDPMIKVKWSINDDQSLNGE